MAPRLPHIPHVLLLLASLSYAQDLLASLDYGTFQGTYSSLYNISYWKKIPFAAPPIGENRFRAPQPPVPITNGTYDSNQSFDFCPQRTVHILFLFDLQLTLHIGQRLGRLPLSWPIFSSLDHLATLTSSRSCLLRRSIHRGRWIICHSTSRIPSPQCFRRKPLYICLPKLQSQCFRLPTRKRDCLLAYFGSQSRPVRSASYIDLDKQIYWDFWWRSQKCQYLGPIGWCWKRGGSSHCERGEHQSTFVLENFSVFTVLAENIQIWCPWSTEYLWYLSGPHWLLRSRLFVSRY